MQYYVGLEPNDTCSLRELTDGASTIAHIIRASAEMVVMKNDKECNKSKNELTIQTNHAEGVYGIHSLSAVWNHREVMYGINPKERYTLARDAIRLRRLHTRLRRDYIPILRIG